MAAIIGLVNPITTVGLHQSHPLDKLYKLGQVLRNDTPEAVYQQLISQCYQPEKFLRHDARALLAFSHIW